MRGVDVLSQRFTQKVPMRMKIYLVICCVDKNFIYNLIEPRNNVDRAVHKLCRVRIENPKRLLVHLCCADVGVRTQENMLERSLALVNLLDGLVLVVVGVFFGGFWWRRSIIIVVVRGTVEFTLFRSCCGLCGYRFGSLWLTGSAGGLFRGGLWLGCL